jgi:hypothetical protein
LIHSLHSCTRTTPVSAPAPKKRALWMDQGTELTHHYRSTIKPLPRPFGYLYDPVVLHETLRRTTLFMFILLDLTRGYRK